MKIISATPIFNLVNNGFSYLCKADDNTIWIRSTAGNWAQVQTSLPMDTYSIGKDFEAFLELKLEITENDIKVDNSSQIIVDPIKVEEPPPPEPTPVSEPIIEPI